MGRFHKAVLFFIALLFVAGIAILAYPILYGQVTDHRIHWNAEAFLSEKESGTIPVPDAEVAPSSDGITDVADERIEHSELLADMQDYNQSLWDDRQSGLNDPSDYIQPVFLLSDYGIGSEAFGVISIPKLGLEMPLYLGATQQHLADGAAVLSQTSIPIGGDNTNAVIAGHRGWNGAAYFRYITDLTPGDVVFITNLWEELRYQVIETKIIAPNEIDQVLIQPECDLITLLTCHPYASGGKQRFLVICERVT